MSSAEYTAMNAHSVAELRSLPFWQVIRYIEASSPIRRRMLLAALAK